MRQSDQGVIVLQAMAGSLPEQSQNTTLTVYYDGSCPLCSAEINHYSSLSGGDRVDFVDASNPEADIGLDLTREQVNDEIRDAGLSPLHNIRRIVRVEEIPVLGTGKTNYRELKGRLDER